MKKLRVLHIAVQPVLVWDDGEELHAGPPIDALTLSTAGLAEFVDRLPIMLSDLESSLTPSDSDSD